MHQYPLCLEYALLYPSEMIKCSLKGFFVGRGHCKLPSRSELGQSANQIWSFHAYTGLK